MQVIVTGASGFLGSALLTALRNCGHEVRRLVRSAPNMEAGDVLWDPAAGRLDVPSLEGAEGVVHLAGESIAHGRWTAARKESIRRSRVDGTRLLCASLARMAKPPRVLACASAIGYYGSRGDDVLTEESPPGSGFLSDVCREWEAATAPALERGIRVVHLRFGLILGGGGGALKTLASTFRMGGGGIVGSGRQYMSWIALEDAVGVILHVLGSGDLRGPLNVVTPNPVTNAEFTKALGRILSRPTLLRLPAFAARLALGEMADALLLSSTRVEPAKLSASGYAFKHPELEGALRAAIARPGLAAAGH